MQHQDTESKRLLPGDGDGDAASASVREFPSPPTADALHAKTVGREGSSGWWKRWGRTQTHTHLVFLLHGASHGHGHGIKCNDLVPLEDLEAET